MSVIQNIPLNLIDTIDNFCRINKPREDKQLLLSIKSVGLLVPVRLEQIESKYRVICGFSRINAFLELGYTEIPAFVESGKAPLALFTLALNEAVTTKTILPSAAARVIHKLKSLGCEEKEIVTTYLPLMGFGRNPKVLELYRDLHLLDEIWLNALDKDDIGIDMACLMAAACKEDRDAYWIVIEQLKLGKNRQKEFRGLLADLVKIKRITLVELLAEKQYKDILYNSELTGAQRAERFKDVLWEERFPRYVKVKGQYSEILKNAKLAQNISIQAPPFFDGDAFTVIFEFTNPQDYKQKIEILNGLIDNNTIAKLNELL